MIPVASSDISKVGYDNGKLQIQFNSGGTYEYYGVPMYVYENLMNAQSHGKYFHSHIKENFSYQKLS